MPNVVVDQQYLQGRIAEFERLEQTANEFLLVVTNNELNIQFPTNWAAGQVFVTRYDNVLADIDARLTKLKENSRIMSRALTMISALSTETVALTTESAADWATYTAE